MTVPTRELFFPKDRPCPVCELAETGKNGHMRDLGPESSGTWEIERCDACRYEVRHPMPLFQRIAARCRRHPCQAAEIVIYAGSVIDVNPAAKRDIELLLERVDDEFGIEQLPNVDYWMVVEAIGNKYFKGEYPSRIYERVCLAPV